MSNKETTSRFETEVTTGTNTNEIIGFYTPVAARGAHKVQLIRQENHAGVRKIDDAHGEQGYVTRNPYIELEFKEIGSHTKTFKYFLNGKNMVGFFDNIVQQLGSDRLEGLEASKILEYLLKEQPELTLWVVRDAGKDEKVYFYDFEKWLARRKEREKVGSSKVIK